MREENMDYISHNIALNLHRIRTGRGMSLSLVAEQTGVSKSMLAQIEGGKANPSIGVLAKIASGLRIQFQELLDAPKMDACLVRVGNITPTKEMEGEYRVFTCFPYEDNRIGEVYRIDLAPGGTYVSGGHGEHTREYISVIEGRVIIESNGSSYPVTREDVFRFETDVEHRYVNASEKEKACLMCFFVFDKK